ncbi:hypothetical protein [Rhizobium viscosum]|uniref:Uncharacterized protein n=1 Tax=Rhizobium viscosum TaxID=1673 RepID=A0ABR9IZ76_RHIVS|nr:hypothetical protein [Rhizobium viscosum]MBE1508527.1 hypothetical protein [Rhizobium viscosum]
MSEIVMQQIILRRESAAALSSSETAERMGRAGATVVDEKSTSLLVEGDEETIRAATQGLTGWRAIPMKRYSIPDTRKKIKG